MNFTDRLARARNGKSILFCGAGFSAGCLNFQFDQELGVASALTNLLNKELKDRTGITFKKITNAAQKYEKEFGESGLMNLLSNTFKVATVDSDMVDVMSYPWSRIYTTNYDDAIELALRRARRSPRPINNLDNPDDLAAGGTDVVHLHGAAGVWNIHNFKKSCILTAESYMNARDTLGQWIYDLQSDYENADIFVFAGFSAGDFHLDQVFFNALDSRPKVFFVNRCTAVPDADSKAEQEIFGTALYIGNAGLAEICQESARTVVDAEPHTPSFRRYARPELARDVPSVPSIRNLFLLGAIDGTQIARDAALPEPQYHFRRQQTAEIMTRIADGQSLVLITGEICDGKSLILEELAVRLSTDRPVYYLTRPYETMVEETARIIAAHPDAVIIVEGCFVLRAGRLDQIISLFAGIGPTLLMSSRSISVLAEFSEFDRLESNPNLLHVRLSKLNSGEIDQLARLADQIGGWAGFPSSHNDRVAYIRSNCHASLPRFMLDLLRSDFVRDRYAQEYSRIVSLTSLAHQKVVVGALYLAHIGYDPTSTFLSDVFRTDCSRMIVDLDQAHSGFRLLRLDHGVVKTVPSIGADTILREVIPQSDPRLVVDTVVDVLRFLAPVYRSEHQEFIFKQLMRYSVISPVVTDLGERNRFFDNVSKIDHCRTFVLFWVQWHMAMVDQKLWNDAQTYLDRAYSEAENWEAKHPGRKFDRFQIDDRKSKFLMIRARSEPFSMHMFHALQESCSIATRVLMRESPAQYPYDTLAEILEFYAIQGPHFPASIAENCKKLISDLAALCEKRKGLMADGYPKLRAERALKAFAAAFPTGG